MNSLVRKPWRELTGFFGSAAAAGAGWAGAESRGAAGFATAAGIARCWAAGGAGGAAAACCAGALSAGLATGAPAWLLAIAFGGAARTGAGLTSGARRIALLTAAAFSLAVFGLGTLLILAVTWEGAGAGFGAAFTDAGFAELSLLLAATGGLAADFDGAVFEVAGFLADLETDGFCLLALDADCFGGWRLLEPSRAAFALGGIFFWAIGSSHSVRTMTQPERPRRKSSAQLYRAAEIIRALGLAKAR
jgi:hypothetical protein